MTNDLETLQVAVHPTSTTENESAAVHNPFVARREAITAPDGHAISLPADIVHANGYRTRKGNLRLSLAYAARAAELHNRFSGRTEPLEITHADASFTVRQRPGEFIQSLHAIVGSVYSRLYKTTLLPPLSSNYLPTRYIPDILLSDIAFSAEFGRFYDAAQKEAKRAGGIATGTGNGARLLVADLGAAVTDEAVVRGKGRDLFGRRWAVVDRSLYEAVEAAQSDDPLPLVFCTVPEELCAAERLLERDRGNLPVLSAFEQIVGVEAELHKRFTAGRTGYGVGIAARFVKDSLRWQNSLLRTRFIGGERHVSIGAFLPHEVNPEDTMTRENRACTVPYLIAEFDGRTVEESFNAATLLVVGLQRMGADVSRVVVSYSGNRSFHVRVPSGFVGNPVYRDAKTASRILARFFGMLTAQDGTTRLLDRNAFNPNQSIRALGSIHPKTGHYCVGMDGNTFLHRALWAIRADSELDAQRLDRLTDPTEARAVPQLVAAMRLAADDAEDARADSVPATGAVAHWLTEGARKGERNEAANRVSLYLIQRHGEREAWEMLLSWNAAQVSPPLPLSELRDTFRSAAGYVARQPARTVANRMSDNSLSGMYLARG